MGSSYSDREEQKQANIQYKQKKTTWVNTNPSGRGDIGTAMVPATEAGTAPAAVRRA